MIISPESKARNGSSIGSPVSIHEVSNTGINVGQLRAGRETVVFGVIEGNLVSGNLFGPEGNQPLRIVRLGKAAP